MQRLTERFGVRRLLIGGLAAVMLLIAIPVGCGWLQSAPPADRADLLRMIAEARDSLDAPGRTVVEAAKHLETAEATLNFVRDQVTLADYRYRRLDPDIALAYRSANAIDKAALLAALLKAQGHDVQIHYADWPRDVEPIRATGLKMPAAVQRLIRALGAEADGESDAEVRNRGAALRASVERASTVVTPHVYGPANDRGVRAPRYRYWVRARKDGGEWQDYDPVFAGQPTDKGYAVTLDDVVPVKIELLSENRAGVRRTLLSWRGPITGDMSLTYLPTVGAQAYMKGNAGPETVPLWTPVLAVGGKTIAGRPFTPDGSAAPASRDGGPLFASDAAVPVPTIRSLNIEQVDATKFPRMEALISADVAGETVWRAQFLKLTDNGKASAVRIESQPASVYGGRTLMFVIDNSGSMTPHLDRMRQIMFDLIDRLGPGVRIGMTHTEAADKLVVPPRFLTDKPALKAEIDAAMKPGGANREVAAIKTILRDVTTPVDILLVGDGELDNPATTGLIRSMIVERQGDIYSILVTGKPDLYRAFSAEVWSALPGQFPDALTARLTDRFSDQLRISWTASGDARDGRQVTLASPGWSGGLARSTYDVAATSGDIATDSPLGPGLILSVSTEADDDVTHLRRIVPLEGPNPAAALMSAARISLVPGLAPVSAMLAANLDAWHAIGTARQSGGTAVPPYRAGPSFLAMARSNAMLRAAMVAYGDALYAERPLVLVERVAIATEGGNSNPGDGATLTRTLDLMNPEALTQRSDEPKPWRIGLAIGAGEGAALEVDGLSRAIVDSSRPIVVRPQDTLPPTLAAIAEARSIHTATRDGSRTLITGDKAGPAAWVVGRGGYLEVRTFDPPGKGANAEQAIREFKRQKDNLRRAGILWSGLAAPYGVPGAPLGGIVGLLEANRKMWCYSSVMMGYVADDIAGQNYADETDAAQWQQRAGTACEINPENFGRELGASMASGAISNQLTDILGGAAGAGYKKWAGDDLSPWATALLSGGLSAGFDTDGGINHHISSALQ